MNNIIHCTLLSKKPQGSNLIWRIMKLTFALLFSVFMQVSASGTAQTINLKKRNTPLTQIFADLGQQSGYQFFYNERLLEKASKVSVEIANGTLIEALNLCFENQPFSYEIMDKTVVVKAREKSILEAIADYFAIVEVKGRVTDDSGRPIPGVIIREKGKKNSTTTNEKGDYQLKVDESSSLVFSYVGYKNEEITLAGRTTLNVRMKEDVSQLKEVTISTGYQTLEKKTFTGSSALIKAADAERSGVPDISRMLEGQVAGVTVQNVSGTFGAAPKIRVRGATSFSGDNKPLWVVDGIILEDVVNISNEALTTGDANTLIGSSVAGLNPDDIESFNILKDAAATGMYGARAMNGVIVVTTKKGRQTEGAAKISYSGNYTTYAKPSYADFDVLNSADQMAIMIEMQNKGYYQIPGASRGNSGGIFYKMYNMLYDYNESTKTWALRNDNASKIAFLSRYANANTDWFDVLFKNSLQQDHSVSINSGTEKFQTYASTSFLRDNGQTRGNSVDRFTGNYRANFKLNDKLSGELLANGSVRNQQTPGTTALQSDPVYGTYYRGFDINPYNYALSTSRLITPYDENGNLEYFRQNSAPFNILNELNTNYLKLGMIDFKVQGGVNYKIIPSLTYSVNGSYRFTKTESQIYILKNSNMATSFRTIDDATSSVDNPNLYLDPDFPNGLRVSVLPDGGFYKITGDNLKSYYFRQNLQYNKTFNKDHNLNVFGAMELRYADRQNEYFDGAGYQFENGGLVSSNYKYFKQAAETGKPYFGMGYGLDRYIAYFSNASYTYKEKYTLKFSTRLDGSNLMGKSTVARWLPTWNLSSSWNIDEESFWPKNKIVNAAKLRVSYGLVANIGNARNSTAVFYNQIARRPNIVDQEVQTYISSLENSQLTWEKTKDLNIGLDVAMLGDRLNLTVDIYKRNIFDLIGGIKTSGIGGQFEKTANYGEMKGNGFELAITGKVIDHQDFKWRTNFNFGYNTNKVTKLEVAPNVWRSISANGAPVEGYSQRSLFSVQFAGLNHDYGYPTFIGPDGKATTYIGLQDDNLSFLKYEGPVDPTFAGGFYNQFSYKGFSLSALFGFSAGNFIRLKPSVQSAYDDLTALSRDVMNRWVLPGDEKFTSVPAILDPLSAAKIIGSDGSTVDIRYPYNVYNYSTERVVKGDYIKLRQLSLTYALPKSIYSKLNMSNAQLSLVGNNIWLIYADKRLNGQDPEFYASGGVAMPVAKQYTLSLKFGF